MPDNTFLVLFYLVLIATCEARNVTILIFVKEEAVARMQSHLY